MAEVHRLSESCTLQNTYCPLVQTVLQKGVNHGLRISRYNRMLCSYSRILKGRLLRFAARLHSAKRAAVLSRITISTNHITTEVEVIVNVPAPQSAEAHLLGSGGEALQRFPLLNGVNHLPLKNYRPGTYGLRISTDTEVTVKEIIIRR